MSEDDTLRILMLVTNSLSLLGTLFVMSAFIAFKSIRSFSFQLVFFMTIADFLHSICLMLPPHQHLWCQVQAFVLQFTAISSILWSSFIAFALYDSVVLENVKPERFIRKYLIFGYILPMIIAIVPAALDEYGYSEGWCWIKGSFYYKLTLRILCFYVFIWAVMVFNVSVYIRVIIKLRQEFKNIIEYQSEHRMLTRRLSMYPLILVITYTPISFKRTFEIFDDSTLPFWVTCLAAIGISITGFLNALVYGLTGPVKTALHGLFFPDHRQPGSFSLYSQRFSENFNTNNL